MHEERKKEYNLKALQQLSKDALAIATELRDPGDGPEKKEILKGLRPQLMRSIVWWSESRRRPIPESADQTIFDIIYGSRAVSGLPRMRRALVVRFASEAIGLRFPPGSERRMFATKFFQALGERSGEEMEKMLPSKEERAA